MTEDAYNELCAAAEQFKAALYKFQTVYDPRTVGIVEFAEDIDTVLLDIREDFYSAEEDEEY